MDNKDHAADFGEDIAQDTGIDKVLAPRPAEATDVKHSKGQEVTEDTQGTAKDVVDQRIASNDKFNELYP